MKRLPFLISSLLVAGHLGGQQSPVPSTSAPGANGSQPKSRQELYEIVKKRALESALLPQNSRGMRGCLLEGAKLGTKLEVGAYLEPGKRIKASHFQFLSFDNSLHSIAELTGHVTVLWIGKSDCDYIKSELGSIAKAQNLGNSAGFTIIPILVDLKGQNDFEEWKQKQVKNGLPESFKGYWGTTESYSGLPEFWISPSTYIIDREGNIAWYQIGSTPSLLLQDRLNMIRLEP